MITSEKKPTQGETKVGFFLYEKKHIFLGVMLHPYLVNLTN